MKQRRFWGFSSLTSWAPLLIFFLRHKVNPMVQKNITWIQPELGTPYSKEHVLFLESEKNCFLFSKFTVLITDFKSGICFWLLYQKIFDILQLKKNLKRILMTSRTTFVTLGLYYQISLKFWKSLRILGAKSLFKAHLVLKRRIIISQNQCNQWKKTKFFSWNEYFSKICRWQKCMTLQIGNRKFNIGN